jgi:hypothetical protein
MQQPWIDLSQSVACWAATENFKLKVSQVADVERNQQIAPQGNSFYVERTTSLCHSINHPK